MSETPERPARPSVSPPPAPAEASPRRVLLEDLLDGLLWPRLLRVPALALRPERLGLAAAAVVVVALLGRLDGLWTEGGPTFGQAVAEKLRVSGTELADSIFDADAPRAAAAAFGVSDVLLIVRERPWEAITIGLAMVLVWTVAHAAIARSAATEIGRARLTPWPACLGLAMRKWKSLAGAVLGPVAFGFVLWLLIAGVGAVTLRLPALDVVGGVLYGLGLVLAAVIAGIVVAMVAGLWMLGPAVVIEGTDAFDAIQRSFAYVLGRPIRLVVYLVIAVALGALSLGLLRWFGMAAVSLADSAAVHWAGQRGASILRTHPTAPAPTGTASAAASVVGVWRALVQVLIAAYLVSYVACASATVYLLCRRVNDEQEVGDLWVPR
jgi:hypothetical protein